MAKTTKNGCRLFNRHPFFLLKILLFIIINNIFLSTAVYAEVNFTQAVIAPVAVHQEEFLELKYSTPELSIRLIDEYQPKQDIDPENWFRWEQKRLQLMAELSHWQDIVEHVGTYEESVHLKHKAWLTLFSANALLKSSLVDNVRESLADLLWSEEALTPEQISMARRLIIRSYLAENKAYDAQRAMLRYQQDYGVSGERWRLLQARVLLATKRYPEAVRLLANETADRLQAFKVLAQLRAGDVSVNHVLETAKQGAQLQSEVININSRRQNWMLIYIAAGIKKDISMQVEALENILITGVADAEYDLINATPDLLWQMYLKYAAELGNQFHLLIGDDLAWFNSASNRIEKDAVAARAIFAKLGVKAALDSQRKTSLQQLALLLKKTDKNELLVEKVFSESKYFSSVNQLPVSIRYQMLDNALSLGKIKQAALLFKFLPEPPEGKKRLAWDIRRARVLVFGGQYQQAKDVLMKVLLEQDLTDEWLNRTMQVVFDLQKVEQHLIAIDLFNLIEQKTKQLLLHRELKFWMAESYQALKKYERSAHLYLISAKMIAEKQSDPWAQTALYRAAEAMMLAGVISDARKIYQQLLKVTESENRRANIKQKLQQLWLLEGKKLNNG